MALDTIQYFMMNEGTRGLRKLSDIQSAHDAGRSFSLPH